MTSRLVFFEKTLCHTHFLVIKYLDGWIDLEENSKNMPFIILCTIFHIDKMEEDTLCELDDAMLLFYETSL